MGEADCKYTEMGTLKKTVKSGTSNGWDQPWMLDRACLEYGETKFGLDAPHPEGRNLY